ncbi:hypothetical protein Acor_33260 [Acrocarpospora corrugata]|uniref:NAD(P)-binding domain-containing protein n=2 Tax=Acrocarpospora corrugata TaxID=35763 RepID=A0A5M3VZS1_9ACTN|nr:hypothetical protein Acor_33260 [Acrocarpospora corrugata]
MRIVAGDVTDAESVAEHAKGHDAAICAVYDANVEPEIFYAGTSRALVEGLDQAGVGRLVVVGLASILETASGALLMDTPDYPQAYRTFYLGHAAGTAVLRESTTALDWLVLSPAGDFDHTNVDAGSYRVAPADAGSRISYATLATAILDEIDNPTHHRTHIGIETA